MEHHFYCCSTFHSHSKVFNNENKSDLRERPFNLKGGVMFFFFLNILIPNVVEKNILILVEEKKNNLIQSFWHITECGILEKKYSNSCVRKKNSERNKKP
jgi:hypothetical protein